MFEIVFGMLFGLLFHPKFEFSGHINTNFHRIFVINAVVLAMLAIVLAGDAISPRIGIIIFCSIMLSLQFVAPQILKWYISRRWESLILPLFDSVTYSLQLGLSPKSAFLKGKSRISTFLWSSLKDEFWFSKFVLELEALQTETHRVQDKISQLRSQIVIVLKYRRKSRAALAGVRTQAYFMMTLFPLVLIWSSYSQRETKVVLQIGATVLFLIGTFWLVKMGKRIKWKV